MLHLAHAEPMAGGQPVGQSLAHAPPSYHSRCCGEAFGDGFAVLTSNTPCDALTTTPGVSLI